MTAIPLSERFAFTKTRRRHGGDWPTLNRTSVEVLGAVNELGPEVRGLTMVKECELRARKAAMQNWWRFLPSWLARRYAYNPIRRGTVYVYLNRLEDAKLVTAVKNSSTIDEEFSRYLYSITPLGRTALAYERQRVIEESGGRETFFRLAKD